MSILSNWIVAAVLCLVSFGLWGFFSRLALDSIPPMQTTVFQTLGILIVTLCLVRFDTGKTDFNFAGNLYAILTGVMFTLGSVLFFVATEQKGKVSIVITLTSLYPIITIILACLLLKEHLNLKQCCGMALAICAMYLLSSG